MVVFSVSWVWPDKTPWFDVKKRDKSPQTYANHLLSFLKHWRKRADVKFIISVHASTADCLVEAFKKAAAPAEVVFRRCEHEADAFYPTLERIVPLFDTNPFTEGHTVVLADIHDGFATQETLLRTLTDCAGKSGAGFTFWPAESTGWGDACYLSDIEGMPLPLASDKKYEYHWHFDAGLAVTTPDFRKNIVNVLGSFERFAQQFFQTYKFMRSTEEVVAEAYIGNSSARDLLRKHACFYVHKSSRRTSPSYKSTQESPPLPHYSVAKDGMHRDILLESETDHARVRQNKKLELTAPFQTRLSRRKIADPHVS